MTEFALAHPYLTTFLVWMLIMWSCNTVRFIFAVFARRGQ